VFTITYLYFWIDLFGNFAYWLFTLGSFFITTKVAQTVGASFSTVQVLHQL
jgi:hypothetical protein